MSRLHKFREILAQYVRHGWRPARALVSAETRAEMRAADAPPEFETAAVHESQFDAIWFTRPAQGGREAWELRLVGETPYALFELFEPDEEEEDREDVRREMEARLADYAGGRKQQEDES